MIDLLPRYYVYHLVNSMTGLVFYVGKGQKGRLHQHAAAAMKGDSSEKSEFIRQLCAAGGDVVAEIVERFHDESDAYAAESDLIKRYGIENLKNIYRGSKISQSVAARVLGVRKAVVREAKPHDFERTKITLVQTLLRVVGQPVEFPGIKNGAALGESYRSVVREMLAAGF